MRILLVLNSADGGATMSALDLVRRLDHQFFVVVPPGRHDDAYERLREVASEVIVQPLPWWNLNYRARPFKRVLHWGYDAGRSAMHARSTAAIVRAARRWDVDLVHTNTSLNLDGALAARLLRLPHIWHLREEIGRQALIRFPLSDAGTARFFSAMSRFVVANSGWTAAPFASSMNNLRVIYNGVDVDRFSRSQTEGRELRRVWQIPDSHVVVGMVANLTARMKRHDVFLRASKLAQGRTARDTTFVIVGHDPLVGGFRSEVTYSRSIHDLGDSLGFRNALRYPGHVNDPAAIMSAIDILMHPSEHESFGRVAVEAMAASRPVVAPRSGGLSEIVVDGQTGFLVRPNDVEEFADRTARLVEDDESRGRLGSAGRRRALEHFDLSSTATQMDDLYLEAIRGGPC